jgi:hypothetical protein
VDPGSACHTDKPDYRARANPANAARPRTGVCDADKGVRHASDSRRERDVTPVRLDVRGSTNSRTRNLGVRAWAEVL